VLTSVQGIKAVVSYQWCATAMQMRCKFIQFQCCILLLFGLKTFFCQEAKAIHLMMKIALHGVELFTTFVGLCFQFMFVC